MNPNLMHDIKWGAVTAIGVTLFEVLVNFDPMAITDWKVWAVGIGGALVRSGAQAALFAFRPGRSS